MRVPPNPLAFGVEGPLSDLRIQGLKEALGPRRAAHPGRSLVQQHL